jgi:glutamate carboxypeptidase
VTTGPSTADIAERLRQSGAARLESTLSLLREMVGINSFTLNQAGVDQVGQLTARAFADLGFAAERVPSTNPDFARHLVLERRGTGGPVVALISHLDTVFPPEEEARHNFGWQEVGDRVYGPGTLDVKGGTAMVHLMLHLLREVAPEAFERVRWIFLLNSSEEMPSADFGQLCRDRIPADALAALVVEGGARAGDSHAVVTARKGRALFRVEAHGRGAHAGNLHERGVNAITQLAHTIRRIEALTNHAAALTFNVGVVSGGSVVNRIPHHAWAEVEMRAFEPEVYQSGLNALRALEQDVVVHSIEDGLPGRVTIRQVSEVPPWPRNPGTERLFQTWQEAGRELGMTVVRQERGGLSDGNHVCAHVPTLDGLGPCGEHAHCSERSADGSKDQEYVERSSFVPRAVLNSTALLRLLSQAVREPVYGAGLGWKLS